MLGEMRACRGRNDVTATGGLTNRQLARMSLGVDCGALPDVDRRPCPGGGVFVGPTNLGGKVLNRPLLDRTGEAGRARRRLGHHDDGERRPRDQESRRRGVGGRARAASVQHEDVGAVSLDELLGMAGPLSGMDEQPPAGKQEADELQEAGVARGDDDSERARGVIVFHGPTREGHGGHERIASRGTGPSDQRRGRLDLSTRTKDPGSARALLGGRT